MRKWYVLYCKYSEALTLYKDTALSMKEIVKQTGVPAEGFRAYLHKWHKELVVERLGIDSQSDWGTDLRKVRCKMKTVATKYAEAIRSMKENSHPTVKVATEKWCPYRTKRNMERLYGYMKLRRRA